MKCWIKGKKAANAAIPKRVTSSCICERIYVNKYVIYLYIFCMRSTFRALLLWLYQFIQFKHLYNFHTHFPYVRLFFPFCIISIHKALLYYCFFCAPHKKWPERKLSVFWIMWLCWNLCAFIKFLFLIKDFFCFFLFCFHFICSHHDKWTVYFFYQEFFFVNHSVKLDLIFDENENGASSSELHLI